MNRPRYLSPSALSAWREDRTQYVLKYLVTDIPRIPQTPPMAVGSAFDAFVKDALSRVLMGSTGQFETLFESQVELHNRTQAKLHGAACFKAYQDSGQLDGLIRLLQRSDNVQILFQKKEDGIELWYNGHRCVLLGYADLSFTYQGISCVLDWKVNGYLSKSGASPKQGHMDHKDCVIRYLGDMAYNETNYLELVEPSWATQLSTYSWLGGMPIGFEFMAMIDQLACSPRGIKVAKHRCHVSDSFQKAEFIEYAKLWDIVCSDHVFRELSIDESKARVAVLAEQAAVFNNTESEKHQWLKQALRG